MCIKISELKKSHLTATTARHSTSQNVQNVLCGKPVQRLKVWKHVLCRRQRMFLNAINPDNDINLYKATNHSCILKDTSAGRGKQGVGRKEG